MKKSDFVKCDVTVNNTSTMVYLIPIDNIKYLKHHSGNTYYVTLKENFTIALGTGVQLMTTFEN